MIATLSDFYSNTLYLPIDTLGVEIIKKQLSDLSKKMKFYGLLDNSLLALTEISNIIPLKAKK